MHRLLSITATIVTLLAAGAAVPAEPGRYVVRAGDSLSLIARRFGCALDDLKRENGLAGDLLQVGQELSLKAPFARIDPGEVRFRRPFAKKGKILESFGPRRQGKILVPRTGVKMACPVGSPVTCPAHAVVRYVGWMDEYGTLVILEHGGGYHTVIAPLDPTRLDVAPGEAVLAGERIGVTAAPLDPDQAPHLHLELRKDEKAVDPTRLLR